jgi:hypothetical protein
MQLVCLADKLEVWLKRVRFWLIKRASIILCKWLYLPIKEMIIYARSTEYDN